MTTTGTSGRSALDIGRDLLGAFDTADWPGFRALLASGVVYEETGTGRRLEGIEAYMAALDAWKRAIPDAHSSIRASFASGDTAVFELIWRGRHSGPLETPSGPIPASGKTVEVAAALATTVEGGKVTSIRHYLDVLRLLQQIGAIPAPA